MIDQSVIVGYLIMEKSSAGFQNVLGKPGSVVVEWVW